MDQQPRGKGVMLRDRFEKPLTLAEVAADYGFTERKLRRLIRDRDIPVLEAGRDIRFDHQAMVALEEALKTPSPTPARISRNPNRNKIS